MIDEHRQIFRDDVLRRYVQSRMQPVLPRFVSSHSFIWLWVLLGLLLASECIIGFTIVQQLGV